MARVQINGQALHCNHYEPPKRTRESIQKEFDDTQRDISTLKRKLFALKMLLQ